MASPAVERMKEALFTGLDYAAMPGDYLRGAIGNTVNRVKGGPLLKDRLTGREMLEGMNWVGADQEGLDVGDVLGFGADLFLDPINIALGGLGAVTGVGRGAVKGARTLAGLASSAGRAESLAGAKAAIGAMPGAAKKILPAAGVLGGTMGSAYGGSALMGSNEEGSDWKDLLGMGMIAAPLLAPLAMAAGGKARKWSKKSVAEALAAEDAKAGLPQFTRTRSVQDETGKWIEKTEPADLLSSDELGDSLSVWGTAGGTAKSTKHTKDVLIARGDVPATPEERTAAATRVLRAFPAHHTWGRRAAKLQEARAALQPGEHGVIPISRPEIDFLEQLGIRDATKWQEIKRMLGGADARTPEAQAVIQQFLPR